MIEVKINLVKSKGCTTDRSALEKAVDIDMCDKFEKSPSIASQKTSEKVILARCVIPSGIDKISMISDM